MFISNVLAQVKSPKDPLRVFSFQIPVLASGQKRGVVAATAFWDTAPNRLSVVTVRIGMMSYVLLQRI